MEQKFIITIEGYLRLGTVRMHKDLLHDEDVCIGGGYYQFDYIANKLILDRESYDYGRPQWTMIEGPLKVPEEYQGMTIEYHYDNRDEDKLNVSERFKVTYYSD
jgi:hypothetical protein